MEFYDNDVKNAFQFTIDRHVITYPIVNKFNSFTGLCMCCRKINDKFYIVTITWISFERKHEEDGLTFNNYYCCNRHINIVKFGNIPLTNMGYQFAYFAGTFSCTDSPECSNNLSRMFFNATLFNGDISLWDVIKVNDMEDMFRGATIFNGDISLWDVKNVKNMRGMFFDAEKFNSNISSWKVDNVTNMNKMFYGAKEFNQDIRTWNVTNSVQAKQMFYGAEKFSYDISNWNNSEANFSIKFYNRISTCIQITRYLVTIGFCITLIVMLSEKFSHKK